MTDRWKIYGSYGTRRTAESVADKIRQQMRCETKLTMDNHGNHLVWIRK